MLPHAPAQRAKLHAVDELQQHFRVRLTQPEIFPLLFDVDIILQRHEFAREADLIGEVDQRLAAFLLLDLIGALKNGVE